MAKTRFLILLLVFCRALSAADTGSRSVTLEWDPNPEPGLLGYLVYRSDRPGGGYQRLFADPRPENHFTDGTPEAGRTYYYVCTAVSALGLESGFSNEIRVTVSDLALAAADDHVSVLEDGAVDIDVTANDSPPGATLIGFSQPAAGIVVQNQGRLRYTPPLNFSGTVHFDYTIRGPSGQSAAGQVIVVVSPVNDPPHARPDQVTIEGAEAVSIDVLANDSDPDGDLLRLVSAEGALGTVQVDAGRLRYQPPEHFSGVDVFTYVVTDGVVEVPATVRVKVDVENRPPEPRDDWSWTLAGQSVAIGLLFNDSDPDGDLIEISSLSQPEGGRVLQTSGTTVRFLPDDGFIGTATFEYGVSDGEAEAAAIATIEVRSGAAHELVFPASLTLTGSDGPDAAVGIALLNSGWETTEVDWRAFGPLGSVVEEQMLPASPLEGGQQVAFGPGGASTTIVAEADSRELRGLFTVVDEGVTRMDGVASRPAPGRRTYLHQLRSAPGEHSLLFLFNPHLELVETRLQLHSANGDMLAERIETLLPLGALSSRPVEAFPGVVELLEGYARIDSDQPIHAFAIRAGPRAFTAEAARPPTQSEELIAPHFYLGHSGDGSRLRILNPGGATVHVEVEAYDDTGGLLDRHVQNLEAGELLSESVEQLLDLRAVEGEAVSGYLRVRVRSFLAGRPSVVGSIEYTGFDGEAATTLPLVEIGAEATVFPHVAQKADEIFTGIALVNPLDERVTARIQAFAADGALTASRDVELGPGQRLVALLSSERLFGAEFSQLGGHIRVTGSGPVVSLATFGSAVGGFLAAIEGQAITGEQVSSSRSEAEIP